MADRDQRHVLVVDDSDVSRRVATLFVVSLGLSADAVGSGTEAVRAVERRSYPLILMDCHMPDMDGFQATAAIRSIEAKTGMRAAAIVAMTAASGVDLQRRCLEAGMNDVLWKPIRLHHIETKLSQWLGAPLCKAADISR